MPRLSTVDDCQTIATPVKHLTPGVVLIFDACLSYLVLSVEILDDEVTGDKDFKRLINFLCIRHARTPHEPSTEYIHTPAQFRSGAELYSHSCLGLNSKDKDS